MIGTSGPSSSTKALSIPRPASADNKCSTVDILTSLLDKEVDKRVSKTFSSEAFIGLEFTSVL